MSPLLLCALLGVATASIAMTLTQTPIFYFVRDRLEDHPMLHHLWECPYCMSHWVAAGFTLAYLPRPFTGQWIDLFGAWFLMVTIAALIVQVMLINGHVIGRFKREQGAVGPVGSNTGD